MQVARRKINCRILLFKVGNICKSIRMSRGAGPIRSQQNVLQNHTGTFENPTLHTCSGLILVIYFMWHYSITGFSHVTYTNETVIHTDYSVQKNKSSWSWRNVYENGQGKKSKVTDQQWWHNSRKKTLSGYNVGTQHFSYHISMQNFSLVFLRKRVEHILS